MSELLPVVDDRTVVFDIVSLAQGEKRDPPAEWERPVHWREAFDDRLADTRNELNRTKSLLDTIDEERYRRARDVVFPLAQSGAQGARGFLNRAGHKLNECIQASGIWEHLIKQCRDLQTRTIAFADVCGGPGAFSQALYATKPKYVRVLQGFGMTLRSTVDSLNWYPSLLERRDFIATYGLEGTGNIYATENLHALRSITTRAQLLLVVGDGGFDVSFDLANYQETISGRIAFGQWLAAVFILRSEGCLVLKLFDTFSPMSRSILWLSTLCFRTVLVVKPKHSRVVNSERYLVCLGFIGASEAWLSYLLRMHEHGFADDALPLAAVPLAWMSEDATFSASVDRLNEQVATRQVKAIHMVLAVLNQIPSADAAVVDGHTDKSSLQQPNADGAAATES